ncbi:uncharacterized protein [Lepeophtheirus salmonis]|uniref:uncharacterized protein n=1 Tax=Lepeophtheirus salmonis TaxID=72036 RepID=UPI001AE5A02B|nr:uncharacterized protein LOC121121831 [Lepeophtheirus salmonis]
MFNFYMYLCTPIKGTIAKRSNMSPFNLIFTLISLYFIASSNVKGLKCYTCNHDTNNPNPKCITHPETQTSSVCNNPEHDHCYTRKIVKINGDEMYFTRACCKIGEANVCPRGSAVSKDDDGVYITYRSRCKGDLCNRGDGTSSQNGSDDEVGGAVILVPGAPGNAIKNTPMLGTLGLLGTILLYTILE